MYKENINIIHYILNSSYILKFIVDFLVFRNFGTRDELLFFVCGINHIFFIKTILFDPNRTIIGGKILYYTQNSKLKLHIS